MQALDEFIRPGEMRKHTGRAISTVYSEVRAGLMPPPVKVGKRASAWLGREIKAVQKARIAGLADEEIRVLVRELVSKREENPT